MGKTPHLNLKTATDATASQLSRPLITSIKREIKDELAAKLVSDSDNKLVLDFILDRIHLLENDLSPVGLIRRFVYIMYALIHHDQNGGLSPKQIGGLCDVANGVLKVAKIQPGKSRLSVLHGEFHTILSQMSRKLGNHWEAAWQQNLADILSRPDDPPGGEVFQAMVMANRALRLGHTKLAISGYTAAEAMCETSNSAFERIRLGHINALRISAAWEAANKMIDATLGRSNLTPEARIEAEWERLCCYSSQQNDISGLIHAVRRGGSHHLPSYIMDALLWAYSFETPRLIERLPKATTLKSRKDFRDIKLKLTLEALVVLEECYTRSLPLPNRLNSIGEILAARQALLMLDKEILVLLAAARWLDRSKASYLGGLTVNEYRLTSQRVSIGLTDDCLGLAGDLSDRSQKKMFG